MWLLTNAHTSEATGHSQLRAALSVLPEAKDTQGEDYCRKPQRSLGTHQTGNLRVLCCFHSISSSQGSSTVCRAPRGRPPSTSLGWLPSAPPLRPLLSFVWWGGKNTILPGRSMTWIPKSQFPHLLTTLHPRASVSHLQT